MSAYQILAIIFTIILIIYIFEIFGTVSSLKNGYPEFWENLGAPDIFSPNGQIIFFKFIFGKKSYPSDFSESLIRKCIRLRYYLISGVVIFLLLVITTHVQVW